MGETKSRVEERRSSRASFELQTGSPEETQAAGRRIGAVLRAGDTVALYGPLGSGKTTFTRGVAEALGVDPATVSSPTFAIAHEYDGRVKIAHLDWYRLSTMRGDDAALMEEYFSSGAVVIVEWAGRARRLLPERRINVYFYHCGRDRRRLILKHVPRCL